MTLRRGVTAKDLILAVIAQIGTGGGQGYVLEYRGEAIRALSMEARMTVCNMSIEAGARAGMIAPDETTFAYLQGRPHAPTGADWDAAVAAWRPLHTDDDATFDHEVVLDADEIDPVRHLGHQPRPGRAAVGQRARPGADPRRGRAARRRAGAGVHGPAAGHPAARHRRRHGLHRLVHQRADRGPAGRGRGAAGAAASPPGLRVLVVPGSVRVRLQAEAEGLDRVFTDAGAEWRGAGCSMCLGMNPDTLSPGERSASTSNRNFEGRQGKGGRTHLVSPLVAAATAVRGTLSTPSDLGPGARPTAGG